MSGIAKRDYEQPDVDKVADILLARANGKIEKVVANQAAKMVGLPRSNETFNTMFGDWKDRRIAEGAELRNLMPAELLDRIEDEQRASDQRIRELIAGQFGLGITREKEQLEKIVALHGERIAILETENDALRESVEAHAEQAEKHAFERKIHLAEIERNLAAAEQYKARIDELRRTIELLRGPDTGQVTSIDHTAKSATPETAGEAEEFDISQYDYVDDDD